MFSLIALAAEGLIRLNDYLSNTNGRTETEGQQVSGTPEHPTLDAYHLNDDASTDLFPPDKFECFTAETSEGCHENINKEISGNLAAELNLESATAPSKHFHNEYDGNKTKAEDAQSDETSMQPPNKDDFTPFGRGFRFTGWGQVNDVNKEQSRGTEMGRLEMGGNECKIMVKNIPFKAKVSELRRFFSSFGKVVDVQLLQEHLRHRSRSKGMAFITFRSSDGVKNVLEAPVQDLTLRERILKIEYAEPKAVQPLSRNYHRASDAKNRYKDQFEDAGNNDEKETSNTCDVSTDDALIHSLYEEILVKVFVLLDLKDRIRVERVCKRWRDIAQASWQSVEALTFTNVFQGLTFASVDTFTPSSLAVGLTDQIFRSILQRGCRNLISLDLSASPHLLTYRSLELIGKRCTRLECINLTGVFINNSNLGQLTKNCNKLKKIVLQRCLGVGEKGFWWLFHNCLLLEYIDIRESKRFRGKCFHVMNSSCHTVIASGCSRIDDAAIYELTAKCTTNLRCLNLSNCYHITDKALDLIAQHCSQLSKLDLSGLVQSVTPHGLCSLKHLTQLTELRLSQNSAVRDEVLINVGEKCKQLRLIDLSGCYDGVHDAGLQGLAGCSQLQIININYLDQVTDEGLKYLVSSCSRITKISTRGCILLTNEAMCHLANQCVLLEDVDVSGCEKLTNATLDVFLETRQNIADNTSLHLTVGGTEIDSAYATHITTSSNGCLVISMHNLAVAIKKFCTEAFFNSDDVSDEEDVVIEEPVVAADEEWPDEYMGLPPDQFADAEAEMEPFNVNPVPAGYHDIGNEERWDMRDDFVNDYLDADDPSMWEEEEWMMS